MINKEYFHLKIGHTLHALRYPSSAVNNCTFGVLCQGEQKVK